MRFYKLATINNKIEYKTLKQASVALLSFTGCKVYAQKVTSGQFGMPRGQVHISQHGCLMCSTVQLGL